jgi:hypothetical protein
MRRIERLSKVKLHLKTKNGKFVGFEVGLFQAHLLATKGMKTKRRGRAESAKKGRRWYEMGREGRGAA